MGLEALLGEEIGKKADDVISRCKAKASELYETAKRKIDVTSLSTKHAAWRKESEYRKCGDLQERDPQFRSFAIPVALAGWAYFFMNCPPELYQVSPLMQGETDCLIQAAKAIIGGVVGSYALLSLTAGTVAPNFFGLYSENPTKEENELSKLKSKYGEVVDQLIAQDIPEELIDENMDLWDFLRRVERNEVISKRDNFDVVDEDGNKWRLSITDNKEAARIEAAANYYLSQHFDFIVPGKFAEPLEANGLYITMQKNVADEPTIERTLDYWISSYAMFHREAEGILKDAGIEIPEVKFRDPKEEVERYLQGRKLNSLGLDPVRLQDAMEYLQNTSYKTLVHSDTKKDNHLGRYLVDLELCGMASPAMDLVLLFMQRGIPEEEWDTHLAKYLALKGVSGSFDEEFKQLKEGMEHAKYYKAAKEIISSSLREVTEKTVRDNLQLTQYALAT